MRTLATLPFITLFAVATAADSLTAQLQDCVAIETDSERLACYDALSQSLNQRAEQNFGQERKTIAEEAQDTIEAAIVQIDQAAYGKLLVTLDNGQIWRQKDGARVNWKDGDTVVVERALFGSFLMKPVDGGRSLRVTRVK